MHGTQRNKPATLAEGLVELLALRGMDLFLANAGTDFPSLIDAFIRRRDRGLNLPRPMAVAHETALMTMAHGYYLATGKPAAAMVHVGIGTANSLGPLMAMSRARIPLLLLAGRTPVTQSGHPASRSTYIHWGQDCFDQAALVREWVKWCYELRRPEELETVIDRALAMALAEPCGPVYLTLPREVLYDPPPHWSFTPAPRQALGAPAPDPVQIDQAAQWLVQARQPLIITTSAGRQPEAVKCLISLAEKTGAAVVSYNPEYLNFPPGHPCHQGFDSGKWLSRADLVLVVACPTPWLPGRVDLPIGTRVIQIDTDPLHSNIPIRHFPSDLTLQANCQQTLQALNRAVEIHPEFNEAAVRDRLTRLKSAHDRLFGSWHQAAQQVSDNHPLVPAWVSAKVGEVFASEGTIFNEYDNGMPPFTGDTPGSYFASPHAGFLGWGVGAALGYKLGRPDAHAVATVGDGSYLFAAPNACHLFAAAHKLPFLTIIYNNGGWDAVRRATRALHPEGPAATAENIPLTEFGDTGNLHRVVEAFSGYGARVDRPEELGPALAKARQVITKEHRQAVINVRVARS